MVSTIRPGQTGETPVASGKPAAPRFIPAVLCWAAFSSFPERAKETYPMLPADWLMQNRFDNRKVMRGLDYDKTKVMLMHGLDDDFTPPEHSRRLYDESGGKAVLRFMEGCNHGLAVLGSDDKDHAQIKRVVDEAQGYLQKLGLCPQSKGTAMLSDSGLRRMIDPSGSGLNLGDETSNGFNR